MTRATKATPRPFKRTGLHRLNCPAPSCPGYAYATVANLEHSLTRYGRLPSCACGEPFEPDTLELADALGVDHADVDHLRAATDNKERAQLRRIGRTGEIQRRYAGTLNDMAARALEEQRATHAATVHARRLSGLNRGTVTAAARDELNSQPIPF